MCFRSHRKSKHKNITNGLKDLMSDQDNVETVNMVGGLSIFLLLVKLKIEGHEKIKFNP